MGQLVLTREVDQVIEIGDDIRVTVIDIRGSKVRLGIEAPKDLPVHRREVADAIRRENRRAAAEAVPSTPDPAQEPTVGAPPAR